MGIDTTSEVTRLLVTDSDHSEQKFLCEVVPKMFPGMHVDLTMGLRETVNSFKRFGQQYVLMDVDVLSRKCLVVYQRIQKVCAENGRSEPRYIYCASCAPPPEIQVLASEKENHYLLYKPVSIADLIEIINE